jgi:outer membrane protein, multidrug efflux system
MAAHVSLADHRAMRVVWPMSRLRGNSSARVLSSTVAAVLAGACAIHPGYRGPATSLPTEWANGTDGACGLANVADDAVGEAWWTGLHDPAIDALVGAALSDNPTLAEAAARVDQARALFIVQRARRAPRMDLAASAARERVGMAGNQAGGTTTEWQSTAAIGPSLSWEIDLWGRVRENTLAARRRLQARDADARDARLSIAAQVADGVLALRACNLLLTVRDAGIASRENELLIIRTRVRLGNLAPVDVAAAESNLATVRIDRIAQEEACLQTVDALVAVSGRPAAEVQSFVVGPRGADGRSEAPATPDLEGDLSGHMPSAPAVIPGLPATVLLAHPGVVAAEREVAARWSEIAVAHTARRPRLDLAGIFTGQWIRAFGSTVSFVVGSARLGLSGPLLDGGAGAAEVARADARYREAVATLDATVRQAVRDIEDGLAAQDSAVRRVEASRSALSAARFTLRANEARRRAGSIGGFELEDSRRQLNRAQEAAVVAARDRAQAWVELVLRSNSVVEAGDAAGSESVAHLAGLGVAQPR